MRFPRSFAAVLVASLAPVAAAQEGALRAMTVDDSLDLVGLGDVGISPGGEWLLYSTSELDWDENERDRTVHRVAFLGDEDDAHPFLGEDGGSSLTFSPDGRELAFLRRADGASQLFRMRMDGGEAVQLGDHEGGVSSFRWSPDGRRIYFTASVRPTGEEKKESDAGDDAIVVDEGPNGQQRGRWRQLWMLDVESEEETLLTEGDVIVGDFDVSPDGARVAYTLRTENRRNQSNLSEIWVLDVASREGRQLTRNESPESSLRWSPDGRRILFSAASNGAWDLRLAKLWTVDVDSREVALVSGAFDGNLRGAAWSEDGASIDFQGQQGLSTNLWRLDVASGAAEPLTRLPGTVGSVAWSRDRRRVAFSYSDFDSPSDLWVAEAPAFQPRRVTRLNEERLGELALARMAPVRWSSSDGLEIEGLLHLPRDWRPANGPLPLMLHIHGGPAGVFTNSFRSSAHVWAGLGYASLSPNVRGSSGYTDALLRGNIADIGGGDYQDLMTGVDALVRIGVADPEQLGVRGWSYGGILGGWTITQTDRFGGASLGAMVSDWTSEYGPGFNHDVRLWYIGGTPWENPEGWRERSALTHVANVTTPTILFHGIEDTTDTEPQSMMFFQALKDRGVETRYLRFPREAHGFREPRHQRRRDVEEIAWMQEHVRGIDWTPWERATAKDDEGAEGDDAESAEE